ncbi:MAG: carboxypeptidase-like regulatory domain-containing protein, partial [Candidatus Saccharimonadales bacterium]
MKLNLNGIAFLKATTTSGQILLAMRLIAIILLAACIQVSAHVTAQSITYSKRGASLKEVFRAIRKQTGYDFLYYNPMIDKTIRIDASFDHTPLKDALNDIFEDEPLTYTIIGHTIVVKEKPLARIVVTTAIPPFKVTGRVTDSLGNPLIGVTIKAKTGAAGTVTDSDGNYALELPKDAVLEISYVGYITKNIPVEGKD